MHCLHVGSGDRHSPTYFIFKNLKGQCHEIFDPWRPVSIWIRIRDIKFKKSTLRYTA
jgi:hypothetical protein